MKEKFSGCRAGAWDKHYAIIKFTKPENKGQVTL